jgi:hypothetical protein
MWDGGSHLNLFSKLNQVDATPKPRRECLGLNFRLFPLLEIAQRDGPSLPGAGKDDSNLLRRVTAGNVYHQVRNSGIGGFGWSDVFGQNAEPNPGGRGNSSPQDLTTLRERGGSPIGPESHRRPSMKMPDEIVPRRGGDFILHKHTAVIENGDAPLP